MRLLNKIKSFIFFDTYGAIATVSFLICAISGIVLAIPFDIQNPYESISIILIANPAANFFRNIHYWSAQFFLMFSVLHIWDHLKMRTEKNQTKGIWFRLSLSVPVIFFVMISGFILKADPDSIQARRIISTLISKIPLFGNSLAYGLFGSEGDYQIIYVQHIATATIFLAIVIWEHAHTLWTRLSTFIIILAVLTVLGLILHAPLHNGLSPVVKGPWYFVGLQEILHWISNTGIVLIFILILILSFYALIYLGKKSSLILKRGFLYLFYVYILLTVIGYFFRGENWSWEKPWEGKYVQGDPFRTGLYIPDISLDTLTKEDLPQAGERREACMACHKNVLGFAKAHDPQAIGCASCHLGDPFSLNKNRAHRNMVLIPGNLANARQTCGSVQCHPEIVPRVMNSLMTSNSGIVSVDRFVFEETGSPDIQSHIKDIGHSAADQHLRNLCANCHLGKEKTEPGPVNQLSRGGGCIACHLNYSNSATTQHMAYISGLKNEKLLPKVHASLDINISNDHCFGCHSRSGRISTNYQGWHETLLDEKVVVGKEGYRVLEDKRVFEFVAEDVHHKAGMDCIDCHNSYEVMGDGTIYLHEEQAVKIRCEDCHLTERPHMSNYDQLDAESRKIFDLRKFEHQDKPMIREKESMITLINTFYENDTAFMIGKNSGKLHIMNPPPSICTRVAHESLTCSACHTAWAPQCIGCHNVYDKKADGYDLLTDKPLTGTWVEYVGKFLAEPPTLGVWQGERNQISPAIPGMILTIDNNSYSDDFEISDELKMIFHRLFAPATPHTTNSKGRDCKSCHNDPLAIGYGRGELIYSIDLLGLHQPEAKANLTGHSAKKGYWTFQPKYAANKYDGLPEDAWIAFDPYSSEELRSSDSTMSATRLNFRPFTKEEQRRILRVGACLSCHDENSEIMLKSLDGEFKSYLETINDKCILPDWNPY
ncbi:MAG: DUF4405 domain-containing protein [Bacteroidales bacterium]|nr:DUF4405 domain-containing protein [Bacteroidales bacterium]